MISYASLSFPGTTPSGSCEGGSLLPIIYKKEHGTWEFIWTNLIVCRTRLTELMVRSVGVVSDLKKRGVRESPLPQVFMLSILMHFLS
jgi:hypothetical protein